MVNVSVNISLSSLLPATSWPGTCEIIEGERGLKTLELMSRPGPYITDVANNCKFASTQTKNQPSLNARDSVHRITDLIYLQIKFFLHIF